jgi:hypothetical protein
MVMLAGTAGLETTTFVSLDDLLMLLPQSDRYNTLTLSPVAAAALLEYTTLITLEFTVPESMLAAPPNEPTNDHRYPVAAVAVAEAAGNEGAE